MAKWISVFKVTTVLTEITPEKKKKKKKKQKQQQKKLYSYHITEIFIFISFLVHNDLVIPQVHRKKRGVFCFLSNC